VGRAMPDELRSHEFGLTLICGDAQLASAASAAGIDRVMIDLERLGKAERQAGRSLFISAHTWDNAAELRRVLPEGRFFMRLDPWHEGSGDQIDRAVNLGADGLMIPFFRGPEPVLRFVDRVAGRAIVTPLVETIDAITTLPQLLASGAIAEFHVGMNDLALDAGYPSLHHLWNGPLLDAVAAAARKFAIPFGVGGVTDPRVSGMPVDPGMIIAQHVRLGSTRALLGRSFKAPHSGAPDVADIAAAVEAIRDSFRTEARRHRS
jgi:2-keto-3-deoxy-L-rhamnonate aldolase RhmA